MDEYVVFLLSRPVSCTLRNTVYTVACFVGRYASIAFPLVHILLGFKENLERPSLYTAMAKEEQEEEDGPRETSSSPV
jgi:hypothetical protein